MPDVLVIEDVSKATRKWWRWRRGWRVIDLLRRIARLARRRNISCTRVSWANVRAPFSPLGATTNHKIASRIVLQFAELGSLLPKPCKIYMSEDSRMSIFDAPALALAFFAANSDQN
jgi:hypothetical protein